MIMVVKRVSDLNVVMCNDAITAYDCANFLAYARILDAVRFDLPWVEAASAILGLDVVNDEAAAYRIWAAHVKRANWIVGDGLALIAENKILSDHLIH
jgi:hypothetical protein